MTFAPYKKLRDQKVIALFSSTGRPAGPVDTACLLCVPLHQAVSHPLQQEGDALAAADAGRADGVLLVPLAQQVHQVGGDARAGGGQRVAQRDGAAARVQLGRVQLQLALARNRLRRERLVDLENVIS